MFVGNSISFFTETFDWWKPLLPEQILNADKSDYFGLNPFKNIFIIEWKTYLPFYFGLSVLDVASHLHGLAF